MIFGDKGTFAIDVEIEDYIDSWVFGRFLFIIAGETIGNTNDSTDLRGCRRWLNDLLVRSPEAVDEALLRLSAREFFATVYDPAMARGTWQSAKYPDAFRRFSISQVGMSSFERFDLLLVGLPGGGHRLFWREAGGDARAQDIGPELFNKTLAECVNWMDATFPPI